MTRPASAAAGGVPRVDLLPRSEIERRERDALSTVWMRVVLAAIVLAALLVGAAFVWSQFAQQRLAAEQARSNALVAQIGGLSEVSGALQTERDLTSFRAEAMGADLGWTQVLGKIEGALPAGTDLVGFSLTPGAAPEKPGDEDAAAQAVGLTGTVSVDSPTPLEIAPLARTLRTVKGVADADANATAESNITNGRFVYTIDITFDQTVYSGDYAKEDAK